ncbi:MAG: DUF1297 domain-containing protein [Nitrososphaeria archaeon]
MSSKLGDIRGMLAGYRCREITIGVLGSHSAEEVGVAAKVFGFKTVVVCQRGREELYVRHNKHLFDNQIILQDFSDILKEEVQERLRGLNTIFLPNRSFSVYVGYDGIEERFRVPIYGNRFMLRTEERNLPRNQYWLLEEAGVRTPRRFGKPEDIDRLVIVKVRQKAKPLERAFFMAKDKDQYWAKAEELASRGVIDLNDLKNAIIEEFVVGPRFNANFQAWGLKDVFGDFDFLGFDDRRQVNIHGVLNLSAREQLELDIAVKNEEIGHFGVTMRESQKPLAYHAAERFVEVCRRAYPPGVLGPFALQGAVAYDPEDPEGRRLEFFVFDVSPRIPGSPSVGPTSPEMRRLWLKYRSMLESLKLDVQNFESVLDFSMLEILYAAEKGRLEEIVT